MTEENRDAQYRVSTMDKREIEILERQENAELAQYLLLRNINCHSIYRRHVRNCKELPTFNSGQKLGVTKRGIILLLFQFHRIPFRSELIPDSCSDEEID